MATEESTLLEPAASKTRPAPMWNVVLLDDDQHTYEYVIHMLIKIFRHTPQTALNMAREVDRTGRVIVDTAPRELAELRREQIESFGPDPLIKTCKGSMSAKIEPAPGA